MVCQRLQSFHQRTSWGLVAVVRDPNRDGIGRGIRRAGGATTLTANTVNRVIVAWIDCQGLFRLDTVLLDISEQRLWKLLDKILRGKAAPD